jgi:hypothetical protein
MRGHHQAVERFVKAGWMTYCSQLSVAGSSYLLVTLPCSRLVMKKAYSVIIAQHVFVLVSLVVRRQSRANEARQHTLTLGRGEAN